MLRSAMLSPLHHVAAALARQPRAPRGGAPLSSLASQYVLKGRSRRTPLQAADPAAALMASALAADVGRAAAAAGKGDFPAATARQQQQQQQQQQQLQHSHRPSPQTVEFPRDALLRAVGSKATPPSALSKLFDAAIQVPADVPILSEAAKLAGWRRAVDPPLALKLLTRLTRVVARAQKYGLQGSRPAASSSSSSSATATSERLPQQQQPPPASENVTVQLPDWAPFERDVLAAAGVVMAAMRRSTRPPTAATSGSLNSASGVSDNTVSLSGSADAAAAHRAQLAALPLPDERPYLAHAKLLLQLGRPFHPPSAAATDSRDCIEDSHDGAAATNMTCVADVAEALWCQIGQWPSPSYFSALLEAAAPTGSPALSLRVFACMLACGHDGVAVPPVARAALVDALRCGGASLPLEVVELLRTELRLLPSPSTAEGGGAAALDALLHLLLSGLLHPLPPSPPPPPPRQRKGERPFGAPLQSVETLRDLLSSAAAASVNHAVDDITSPAGNVGGARFVGALLRFIALEHAAAAYPPSALRVAAEASKVGGMAMTALRRRVTAALRALSPSGQQHHQHELFEGEGESVDDGFVGSDEEDAVPILATSAAGEGSNDDDASSSAASGQDDLQPAFPTEGARLQRQQMLDVVYSDADATDDAGAVESGGAVTAAQLLARDGAAASAAAARVAALSHLRASTATAARAASGVIEWSLGHSWGHGALWAAVGRPLAAAVQASPAVAAAAESGSESAAAAASDSFSAAVDAVLAACASPRADVLALLLCSGTAGLAALPRVLPPLHAVGAPASTAAAVGGAVNDAVLHLLRRQAPAAPVAATTPLPRALGVRGGQALAAMLLCGVRPSPRVLAAAVSLALRCGPEPAADDGAAPPPLLDTVVGLLRHAGPTPEIASAILAALAEDGVAVARGVEWAAPLLRSVGVRLDVTAAQ